MKKISILAIALITLQSCVKIKSDDDGRVISFNGGKATGPITDKTYSGDFSSIEVSSGLDAEVIKSDTEKVIISAPSDIQDRILVENNSGELHVHFKSGFRINMSTNNIRVKIYAKDFNSIKANSSADITVRDKFTQDKMNVSVSSSGSINGDFEANDLSMKSNSSGTYKGSVWAVNASAEASSSGDVSLAVSKQVTASASSSGDVVVYKNGNPSVTKNESSSGSVTIR